MKEIEIAGQKAWVDNNGRIYMICAECKKFVRINKPFVGSLHLCTGR